MPIEVPSGLAAQRPDRNPEPNHRQLWILAAGITIAIAIGIWTVGAISNQLVQWIPPQVEQQLGAVMAAQFEDQVDLTSPEQQALSRILTSLTAELPIDPYSQEQTQRRYQVWYIPDETVNALALPGDRIIVYQGLIAQIESENALAMVLGHELGHFAHRDHLRGLGRAIVWQLALSSIFGDVSGWQRLAIAGLEQLSQAQYSQQQERQADEFGLELLQATYNHVGGATDFFVKLAQTPRPNPVAFLATHPMPQARIERLNQLIQARGYLRQPTAPLPPALRHTAS